MKSTSNKVHVNNFKHMAGLATKFLKCFNFCRISLEHSAMTSVLGARYQTRLEGVDILIAVFYSLEKHCGVGTGSKGRMKGECSHLNAFAIVLIYGAYFCRDTCGRKFTHSYRQQPTTSLLTRCNEGPSQW